MLNNMNYVFLLRSVRSLDEKSELFKYIKNAISNSTLLTADLLNFILVLLDLSKNHSANRHLVETLLFNISKVSKVDKFTIIKLVKTIKREGKLNYSVSNKLAEQFHHLADDLPIFMQAYLNKEEGLKKVFERIGKVNFNAL